MNFKQWLIEMPITKFQLTGKWDKPQNLGWSSQDKGILTNPTAIEKIHRSWANTKENFDLYFVKQPGASKFLETGEVTPEWVKEKLNLDIQPNPANITIIFTNNRGDEKIPMTAWIIAHRVGHSANRAGLFRVVSKELNRDFGRILREAYNYNYTGGFGDNYSKDQQALLALGNMVGTMRSVRQNNLRNWGEFVYELFAQRL